jgi:hypothetical protein
MVFEGDMNVAGSFCDADLRAIRNPKWQAKVERYLSRLPFKFDLIIRNQTPEDHFKILTKVILGGHTHQPESNILSEDDLKRNKDDTITIILGGNRELGTSANKINGEAFTPWILVHRMAHAMDFAMAIKDGAGWKMGTAEYKAWHTAYSNLTNHLPVTYENYGIKTAIPGTKVNDFHIEVMTKYMINNKLRPHEDGFVGPLRQHYLRPSDHILHFEQCAHAFIESCVGKVFYF